MQLRPGEVIAGKYRLGDRVGTGAFGEVFRAEHTGLGKTVAVKFLLAQHAKNATLVRRFEEEAKKLARLRHSGILEVYDVGALDDGRPFMVMEFLEGSSLASELRRERVLPVGRAVAILGHVLEATAVAHASGIIHRDIKPENLFLAKVEGRGETVKVLDFGIAKALADGGAPMTVAGRPMGTPQYMPPEQALDPSRVDARADVYAIGATFFEMLTGRTVIDGEDLGQLLGRVVGGQVERSPARRRPEVPRWLDALVVKALAQYPEDRFADAAEMLAALRNGQREVVAEGQRASRATGSPPMISSAAIRAAPHSEDVTKIAGEVVAKVEEEEEAQRRSNPWPEVATAASLPTLAPTGRPPTPPPAMTGRETRAATPDEQVRSGAGWAKGSGRVNATQHVGPHAGVAAALPVDRRPRRGKAWIAVLGLLAAAAAGGGAFWWLRGHAVALAPVAQGMSGPWRLALADGLVAEQRPREALEELRLAGAEAEKPEGLLLDARARLQLGDEAGASQALDLAMTERPDDATLALLRAQIDLARGNAHAAAMRARTVHTARPTPESALVLGTALYRQGQLDQARPLLTAAISGPQAGEAALALAALERSAGDLQAARAAFDRALAALPAQMAGPIPALARAEAATLAWEAGDAAAALAHCKVLRALPAPAARALAECARIAIERGELDQARADLARGADTPGGSDEPHLKRERGRLALAGGDAAAALPELLAASDGDEHDGEAAELALTAALAANDSQGRASAEEALGRRFPGGALALWSEGVLALADGKAEAGLMALGRAAAALLADATTTPRARALGLTALGMAQLAGGEHKDRKAAEQSFAQAVLAWPLAAQAACELGRLALRHGDLEPAEHQLAVATQAAPGHAEAWYMLGQVRRKRGDVAGARTALETFVRLAPSSKDARDAYRLLGSLPEK